jgi:hypothetical protein
VESGLGPSAGRGERPRAVRRPWRAAWGRPPAVESGLGPSAGRGERPGAVRMLVFLCGVTVWGGLISSQRPFEGLQISSSPQKNLIQKEKLIFFSTYVLSLNLDENFMGIAVLYFASLCLFFRRFFEVLKINFITKSVKVQI